MVHQYLLNLETIRILNNKINFLGRKFYLLGLIRGHWNWDEDDSDSISEEIEAINMGIAIVTPTIKILDIVNHPNFF